jgi:hypothetical protein
MAEMDDVLAELRHRIMGQLKPARPQHQEASGFVPDCADVLLWGKRRRSRCSRRLGRAPGQPRLWLSTCWLVASALAWDLLVWAKDLFIAAMVAGCVRGQPPGPKGAGSPSQWAGRHPCPVGYAIASA